MPFGLGREEGLEDHFGGLSIHPATGVAHGKHHVLARLHVWMCATVGVVQDSVRHLNGELSLPAHGVAAVDREVQKRIFELGRIGECIPKATGYRTFHLGFLTERPAKKLVHPQHQTANIDGLGFKRLSAAKRQQLSS